MQALIDHQADMNLATKDGATAGVFVCVFKFHTDTHMLMCTYERMNSHFVLYVVPPSFAFCLHHIIITACIAAKTGRVNALRLLGKNGADLNKVNLKGVAPVHIAAFCGSVDSLRALDDFGADLSK
jgi:hypothetical protein